MSASPDTVTESPDEEAPVALYEDGEDDNAVTLQMDAPVDDRQWMVQFSAVDRRMLSTEELLSEVASGRLSEASLVWRNGMPSWSPFSAVEELEQARREAPVAAPPRPAPVLAPPPPRAALVPAPAPLSPPPPPVATVRAGTLPLPARAPLPPSPPPPRVAPASALGTAPSSVATTAAPPSTAQSATTGTVPAVRPPPTRTGTRRIEKALAPPPAPAAPAPAPKVASESWDDDAEAAETADAERPTAQAEAPRAPVATGAVRGIALQGAAAVLALVLTSYGLMKAGVFDADKTPSASQPISKQVNVAPMPVPAASAPVAAPAAPAPAVAPSASATTAPPAPTAGPAPTAAAPTAQATEASGAQPEAAEGVKTTSLALQPKPAVPAEPAAGSTDGANEEKAEAVAPAEPSAPLTPAQRRSQRRAERLARIAAARAAAASRASSASSEERPHRRATAPAAEATEAAAGESSEAQTSDGRGTNFDRAAAQIALEGAATQAKNCRPLGGPSGSGVVQVQYEPSGKVSSAVITTAGFENTSAASCITMLFRRARIAPFNSSKSVTVKQRFEIP